MQGGGFNTQDSLASWYKYDWNLSDNQREGLDELTELYMDLSEIKLRDMVSADTGQTILRSLCNGIETMEVDAPETVTFGKYSDSVFVRPVSMKLRDDFAEKVSENSLEVNKKIAYDEKLIAFMKGFYSNYVRQLEGEHKLYQRDFEVQTESEYHEQVDSSIESQREFIRKAEESGSERDGTTDYYSDYDPGYEIINQPVKYYIDMETGYLAGTRSETIIKATDKTLDQYLPDSELRDLLEEGFVRDLTRLLNYSNLNKSILCKEELTSNEPNYLTTKSSKLSDIF